MGTLVDVYIAKRKNHLGQMFAFCRYIKVSDSKTLIDSLSYVWIGKLRLHANVARFDRNVVSKPSHAGKHKIVADSARTIVLDDECIMERDLSCGFWVLIDVGSLSSKEKFLNHKGVASYFTKLLSATNSFVSKGVLSDVADDYSLPFKRLCVELKAWSLDFNNEFCEDSSSDDESVDEEVDHVSDTHDNGADFDKEKEVALLDRGATYGKRKDFILDSTDTNDKGDDDLDKEKKDDYVKSSSDMNVNGAVLTIMDTYVENLEHSINQPNASLSINTEGTSRAKSGSNRSLQLKPGGSILDVMEGLVEVGQNVGYHMEDPTLFSKDIVTISNSFLAIRGDFNEVRSEHERFGTMFNASGANAFNHFISSAGLVDLPFEGKSNEDLVNERTLLLKDLQDINSRHSLDTIQKAKIHWAIEGYENSRYFYGIINKKRSQLVIRAHVMSLDPQMFKRLSPEQNVDLESNVTYEEITKVIWDCGTNKSPRPDGFTFDFFRKYWKTVDQDVVNAVQDFFITSKFPPGSNFTFVTLIPKKQDAEALYGDRGSLDNPCYTSCSSLWYNIIREFETLFLKGINLQSHIKKKVGNGVHTLFWEDTYLHDLPLMNVFPRLYTLECDKKVTVAMKLTDCYVIDSFRRPLRGGIEEDQLSLLVDKLTPVILTDSNDRWIWSIDSTGEFSVKSA
nr:RNA-directed DNA polymerase, eukaryota, reverse transcriptase zinc-binding domain protein [Tanacetum cinerariifolium]